MSTTSSTKSTKLFHDAPSASLNERAAVKEVRAHEHARHRTKERRDHALTRERKEKAAAARVLGLKVAHGTKLVRKLSMESWDGEEPAGEHPRSATVSSVQVVASWLVDTTNVDGHVHKRGATVSTLGDLISKPRRPKAKQLDFEVIPPVRSVIALDDADADADEPWEYVTRASLIDGCAWKGKSYAQAVANAM